MSEQNSLDVWLRDVTERMQGERKAGAAPKAETLTVRQFLNKFGNARRGYRVVGAVRQQLEKYHLRTSPDFEFEYIDTPISIELDNDVRAKDTEKKSVSPTVRIDCLTAAHNNPVRVSPDDSVVRATTVMWVESFSQLPVMTTDREVKGIVSWRSIGMAYAEGRSPSEVRECMEDAHEIDIKTGYPAFGMPGPCKWRPSRLRETATGEEAGEVGTTHLIARTQIASGH